MIESPLWPALLACALAIAFALAGRRRIAIASAGIATVCVLAMTPFAANALLRWLEQPYASTRLHCDGGDVVVVLAGGVDREALAPDDHDALSDASVRRLVRAIELLRETRASRLVVTGGGAWRVPESAVLASLAHTFGADPSVVTQEAESTNTWQGAQVLARDWRDADRRIWLVTSAWHLRRAMIAYEAAGFTPCPVATDRRLRDSEGWWALLPQASGLRKTEVALHELAGIAWYRWKSYRAGTESIASS